MVSVTRVASVTLLAAGCLHGFQAANRPGSLRALSSSIRELTQQVSPAIVQVLVTGYGAIEDDESDRGSLLTRQRSTGSGVIVDSDGYIITNAHVVRGAISVKVLVSAPKSGAPTTPLDARILGLDRSSDLALIEVNRGGLPALPFANSDALQQGDMVLAIGSPLGLKNSVSLGVVSASARLLSEDSRMAYIQTDASINPGNSGGALVDVEGKLVGINSFILTQSGGSEGIGFAIPSNTVQSVYEQLRKKGHVHHGEIGASVQSITPVMAAGLGLARQTGVIVSDVEEEGAADQAGLKQGDILLELDGKSLAQAIEFESVLYRRRAGEKLNLKVLRENSELTVAVPVEEKESDDDMLADLVSPEKNLVSRLGILCIEIDKKVAEMLPELRQQFGVIVAAKAPQGPGRYIDLQAGDVIHAINNLPVSSLELFKKSLAEAKSGSAIVLTIERDGAFRYIAFELD